MTYLSVENASIVSNRPKMEAPHPKNVIASSIRSWVSVNESPSYTSYKRNKTLLKFPIIATFSLKLDQLY